MLNISCSILEQVRQNPITYAQMLGTGGALQKGGTYGMFAYWQDTTKRMHQEGLTISEALKELSSIYHRRFEENVRNGQKQEVLYKGLVAYEKAFKAARLSFYNGKRRMQWPLVPEIQLTGLTPWVFKKGEMFHGCFYSERSFHWQSELKYPLLQHYMAEHIIECDPKNLHVGLYFLDTQSFETRSYTTREISDAISEATSVFENVQAEITRKRNHLKSK